MLITRITLRVISGYVTLVYIIIIGRKLIFENQWSERREYFQVQQANWDLQFENWTTPKAANEVLSKFYYNEPKLLSKKSYNFLWKTLKETKTGESRLKGQLPNNTIVAHKTGSSGTNKEGLTAAVNDIGIVFLPNGQHYFISVFVTKSYENNETNEKIISDISKATWNYFIKNQK